MSLITYYICFFVYVKALVAHYCIFFKNVRKNMYIKRYYKSGLCSIGGIKSGQEVRYAKTWRKYKKEE